MNLEELLETLHRCRMAGIEGEGCEGCRLADFADCQEELMGEAEDALMKMKEKKSDAV